MSKEGLKKSAGGFLKQRIGHRDTIHGLLDLPVTVGKAAKKPKLRFVEGGAMRCRDGCAIRGKTRGEMR